MSNKPIVVFYHATSPILAHGLTADMYRKLCNRFVNMCWSWDLEVVHLTTDPDESFGCVRIVTPGDSKDIVYNREKCFTRYLKYFADPNKIYLFTEPDTEILKMWPALPQDVDLSLLYRMEVFPHISPSWRLCRTTALPFFESILTYMNSSPKGRDWHGDSEAFNKLHTSMYNGLVNPHVTEFVMFDKVRIQFRSYEDYMKPRCTYMRHYIAEQKRELLNKETRDAKAKPKSPTCKRT